MTAFSSILNEREEYVISHRGQWLGVGKNAKTLAELGKELSISGNRVRQIEAKAYRKIKGVQLRAECVPELRKRIAELEKQLETYTNRCNNYEASIVLDKRIRSLAECEFSVRTHNCLIGEGCVSIWDVLQRTRSDLMRIPNFGRKSMRELIEYLDENNIKHSYGW